MCLAATLKSTTLSIYLSIYLSDLYLFLYTYIHIYIIYIYTLYTLYTYIHIYIYADIHISVCYILRMCENRCFSMYNVFTHLCVCICVFLHVYTDLSNSFTYHNPDLLTGGPYSQCLLRGRRSQQGAAGGHGLLDLCRPVREAVLSQQNDPKGPDTSILGN